jgi:hypothetical protein
MTEAEWLACNDSHVMLDDLALRFPKLSPFDYLALRYSKSRRPQTESERPVCPGSQDFLEHLASQLPKPLSLDPPQRCRAFRLFNVACCYRVWPWIRRPEFRHAVTVAEQYADGLATNEAREQAFKAALGLLGRTEPLPAWWRRAARRDAILEAVAAEAAVIAAEGNRLDESYHFVMENPFQNGIDDRYQYGGSGRLVSGLWPNAAAERAAQAELLRDLFGDLFRLALAAEPAWLAWQGGIVARLARAAYEERRMPEGTLNPARLAPVAHALEDAGCTDAELLGHLRGPGPHVRGCWALDLILGRS